MPTAYGKTEAEAAAKWNTRHNPNKDSDATQYIKVKAEYTGSATIGDSSQNPFSMLCEHNIKKTEACPECYEQAMRSKTCDK